MSKKQIISLIFISLSLIALSFFLYSSYFNTPPQVATNNINKKAERPEIAPKDTTPFERLQFAVEDLANSDSMKHAGFGFYLATIDSETVLLEHNSELSLVPASVMKTVTTGVGLTKLGTGFHYTTRLQYDGTKTTTVLNGNIYIKGMGDPSLGSPVFKGNDDESVIAHWVAAVKNLGIDTINGAIVGDAEVFEDDQIPAGWAWEDMQSDYGIGPCGLSFHENVYDIHLTGGTNYLKISPEVPELKLYNNVVKNTGGVKNYAYVMGAPYLNERVLKGEITSGTDFTAQSAVPDPAYFCAYQLYSALKKNGIIIRDSATTAQKLKRTNKFEKKERITFHSTFSPSLASLVNYTNQVSHNFYAETILRTLSLMENGYGSTAGGTGIVYDYFRSKGIRLGGFYMVDGSGVSRFDGITARQLGQMLTVYAKDTIIFDAFYNSLPVAGESGTINSLCKGTLAENNIHAKSGYMTRVRSYAGYVTTKSGQLLVFAMLTNNHGYTVTGMRDQLERLMILMAELD